MSDVVLVVVAVRDLPVPRSRVWGSSREFAFSGTVLAPDAGVPLVGGWSEGVVVPSPIGALRVWSFWASTADAGDWDTYRGTREELRVLVLANQARVWLWRPSAEGMPAFHARWRAATQAS